MDKLEEEKCRLFESLAQAQKEMAVLQRSTADLTITKRLLETNLRRLEKSLRCMLLRIIK